MENKYVIYSRVSTKEQGDSGLGLLAQKKSCLDFVESNGGLLGDFQDIISGTVNSREGIDQAINLCKKEGATLVVKEISRISRNGMGIMLELEKAGVKYIESTSPHDPSMLKGIKFILAKEERDKISERTSSALSEIKGKISRGEEHISKAGNIVTGLGNPKNLTDVSRERSIAVRKAKASSNENNKRASAFIGALRDAGESFYTITKKLNKGGFLTSRGGQFSQVQTKRLCDIQIN
tara:strand:+ start:618 stop:1328 length:711 start_codon:yes stop_codon:yes gene_type:complete